MNHTSTSGCCAAGLVYNIGGAHGHKRYLNIAEFYDELKKNIIQSYRVWYLFLSGQQNVELAHIRAAGDTFVVTQQSDLYLVSTTFSKFNKWYNETPIFTEAREAKRLKDEEDKRKREEEERIRAERRAAEMERIRVERERIAAEKAAAKAKREADIAAGLIAPSRKRGELRVDDKVFWYRTRSGTEVRNGVVVRLLEGGDVVIRGPRGTESTITPKFNSGYGGHNIERIKPKSYW